MHHLRVREEEGAPLVLDAALAVQLLQVVLEIGDAVRRRDDDLEDDECQFWTSEFEMACESIENGIEAVG